MEVTRHLLVNTEQTCEQVPLWRALWSCSYCGGGGGELVRRPPMPPNPSSLRTLSPTRGHVGIFCCFHRVESEVSRGNPAAPSHHTKPWTTRKGLAGKPRPFLQDWSLVQSAYQITSRRRITSMYPVISSRKLSLENFSANIHLPSILHWADFK